MKITVRQLRYLQAVVKYKNFGRAAKACHVSQPALSMQVRQLEEILGVQLIDRLYNELQLTAHGKQIINRVDDIILQINDLENFALTTNQPMIGELRLGVIPSLAPYLLPFLLPKLSDNFPNLKLKLRETQTENLLTELNDGELDILLLALPVSGTQLLTQPLFEDHFLMAINAGHPAAKSDLAMLDVLEKENLLLLEEGHCFRDQALSFCRTANPNLKDEFGATSLSTVLQMVASGYGVTLVPQLAVDADTISDKITTLPFVDPQPSRTIGLAWRSSTPRDADIKALSSVIQSIAAQQNWPLAFDLENTDFQDTH